MRILILVLSMYTNSIWCLPPPHPAVVAVRREEERLPPHLRSPALFNPHLREVLPLTSVLHKGEKPVYHRESDHVPRQEIYNILTHAGFLPRRPGFYQPPRHRNKHRPAHRPNDLFEDHFHDPSLFFNPDLLQHL
ncbi:hypothetical protein ACJJTC_005624 [Scirpophaga incertulas]